MGPINRTETPVKKTTNQRCLISQKNEILIYTAEENFDHKRYLKSKEMYAEYDSGGALIFFKCFGITVGGGGSVQRRNCVFCLTNILPNALRSGGYSHSYVRVTFQDACENVSRPASTLPIILLLRL